MAPENPNVIMAWFRLFRIANLPSAISNVLMAYLLANGSWTPTLPLFLLLLSSASLYSAGMVLNDVFDLETDRAERPNRPLPSGAISAVTANRVGFGLLWLGVLFALIAGLISGNESWVMRLRPVVIALALSISIYLYDSVLKKTPVAPPLMGLCRGLNILLGASTVWAATAPGWAFGFSPTVIWVAASVFVLITGITWLARNEATQNAPFSLAPAGLVLGLGLVGLAAVPLMPGGDFPDGIKTLYPLLILLVSIPIIRKALVAVATGKPEDIQKTVVALLRSLIIFDASVCYLAAPGEVIYAIAVVCLVVPSFLLGLKIRST